MEKGMELTVSEQVDKLTIQDVRAMWCPYISEREFLLAMGIARAYNLNPFKREIHFIKYSQESQISIVVGYEVYLKRAERTGKLKNWFCEIVKAEDALDKTGGKDMARITINRKDWDRPFVWEILRREVAHPSTSGKNNLWNTQPDFMFKKVAIGQGFRLAFPDELGGMPLVEGEIEPGCNIKPDVTMPEIDEAPVKAEVVVEEPEKKPEPKKESKPIHAKMASASQCKLIASLILKNPDPDRVTNSIIERYEVNLWSELSFENAETVIKKLSKGALKEAEKK